MATKIIAFDPGGTTGVAIATIRDDQVPPKFSVNQLSQKEHHHQIEILLDAELRGITRKFVIYEAFEYRQNSRAGLVLDSREYIGIIKNWTQNNGVPVVSQSAAQGKGFVPDNVLKQLNLYTSAYRHANDAMRHLIYFIVNNETFKFNALKYELDFRKTVLELGFK